MDVLKFLQSGNISKNPNYNPKTKEGKLHSPLLVDYKVGKSVSDKLRSNIASNMSKNIYGLDSEQIDKYAEYNTYLNPFDSQEELNRQRAENQSALEQLGNLAVQAVGNEVVLGTLLGISNLIDMGINAFADKGKDDYTNPVSLAFEEAQNAIRERFEIYRKDPNATWAINDFGWLADNAVSIASTASMLIPTGIAMKGLSLIGKGIKAQKAVRGITKMLHNKNLIEKPATWARNIEGAAKIGTSAVLSRTMEGYLEAREVYNSAYEDTLDAIKQMDKKERTELFRNNRELLDGATSDEEIASRIASVSADKTFKNDYAMLLFDIAQFKALGNVWKGKNKVSSAGVRLENKKVINSLSKSVDDNLKTFDTGFIARRKESLNHILKNPLNALASIELTEGIEEGYQGVMTEKGKEVAKKIIDPNFTNRTIESYIKDPAIWEQATWGILGGVGFKVVGNGLGRLEKMVEKSFSKNISEQDAHMRFTADEKLQVEEINGRIAATDKYISIMKDLNGTTDENGNVTYKNPFAIKDKDGKLPTDEFGNPVPETLSKEEAELYKQKVTEEYLNNMVMNAADAGNWDLFKEFVTSKEFEQYFKDSGIADGNFTTELISRMDNVYEEYQNAVGEVFDSVFVDSPYVGLLVARDIVNKNATIRSFQSTKNNLEAKVAKYNDQNSASIFRTRDLNNQLLDELKDLDSAEQEIKSAKNITKYAREQYLADINKQRNQILNLLNQYQPETFTPSSKEFNTFVAELNKYMESYGLNKESNYVIPTKSTLEDIKTLNTLDIEIAKLEQEIPKGQKELQELYDEYAKANDSNVIKKYAEATDKIIKWIESQEDLTVAKNRLLSSEPIPEIDKELQMIKIGHHNTTAYTKAINKALGMIEEDRKKKEAKEKEVTVGNTKVSEPVAEIIKDKADNADNTETTSASPSTGGVPDTQEVVADEKVAEKNAVDELKRALQDEIELDDKITSLQNAIKSVNAVTPLRAKLTGKDINSAEFKEVVDAVKQQLVTNNKLNITDVEINRYVKQQLDRFNRQVIKGSLDEKINFAITSIIDPINVNTFNELIESYLNESIDKENRATLDKDTKTIIDLSNFFKYIINNKLVNEQEAAQLFNIFKKYIADNNQYVFINYEYLNDMELFVQNMNKEVETITENYMHIKASSDVKNKDAKIRNRTKKAIKNIKNGDKLFIKDFRDKNGKGSLSIRTKDDIEIGYLGAVRYSDDGNILSLANEPSAGFLYYVEKTTDDNYKSNTDKFFNDLLNFVSDKHKELYNLLYKDYVNKKDNKKDDEKLTDEEYEKVFNLAKELLNGIYIFDKGNKHKKTIAKQVLDDIQNIIFYSELNDTFIQKSSYKDWIKKKYDNYKNTFDIQENLAKGNNTFTFTLAGKDANKALYDPNHSQSIANLNFNPEVNKVIIRLNSQYDLMTEDEKGDYDNRAYFNVGFMGIIIQDNKKAPIVAKLTGGTKISLNQDYANAIKSEIINILKGFHNGTYTYEDVKNKFNDLFNSPISRKHNLFNGYHVIESNNRLFLNIDGTENFNLIIHKFKKGESVEGKGITYNPNGDKNSSVSGNKFNSQTYLEIATEIVNNLTFNRTFFPIINRHNKNTNDNQYMFKKDGKFVVKIGNMIKQYDSFTHFAIKENAYKTNQLMDESGSYFSLDGKVESMYIDMSKTTLPVEGEKTRTNPEDVIKSANKENGVTSTQLIRASTLDIAKQNILLGDKGLGINLLPETVYYDESNKESQAYYRNGKIYITALGAKTLNNSTNLVRLLLHEHIHAKLAELGTIDKNNIVKDLLRTYNEFVEVVNKDTSKTAKDLQEFIKTFNPVDYFNNLSDEAKSEWANRSQAEKDRYFAEEWLVETLTQPTLMEYLNNVQYSEKVIIEEDDSKKSIFQKIIELVLKLFGKNFDNVQNNTILAKQYSLLWNEANEAVIEESVVENVEEQYETTDDEDLSNWDNLAVTKLIGENRIDNGVVEIDNMNDFVSRFDNQDQPLISQMVANNQINFVC